MRTTITVAIAVALLVPPSLALAKRPIAKRADRQENRIEEGVDSGKLTDKEAERLKNQQDVIDQERENAREDGKVTRGERREIRHDQNKASHAIRHKKHDDHRE